MALTQASEDRELFRSYWDDGLVDLLFGAALLVTGLGWESSIGALAVIQAPLWVILWAPLRRRFVEPHAGFVEFSLGRRRRNSRALLWSVSLGFAALVLYALAAVVLPRTVDGFLARRLVQGLPAMLVALGAIQAGLLLGAVRFAAYAVGLALAAAVTVVLSSGPAAPLVVGGLGVTGVGATLLGRFLRSSREFEDRSGS
jgi:hypothetical protein